MAKDDDKKFGFLYIDKKTNVIHGNCFGPEDIAFDATFLNPSDKNVAIKVAEDRKSAVESAYDYLENFDILETITNVGNDEVFTPRRTCERILDALPDEVWHNPNYRWLNPATKNGIFEREIALRLDKGLKDVIPDEETRRKHILQKMIFAIGQTKFTSYVARRTLYYCMDANRQRDLEAEKEGKYYGYAIGNGTWFNTKEGNVLTPKANHDFDRSERCRYCRLPSTSKYLDSGQREQYAYEFIHHCVENGDLLGYLQDVFFKGDRNMKFDIIIGNPPYQLSTDGHGAQATPIYQMFVDNAKKLQPKYLCMIIPSRWMTGGMGLDEFRASMLSDRHISVLHDYLDPKECFPNNDIKGGVCYFVWDKDYSGKADIYTHMSTTESGSEAKHITKHSVRYLADGDAGVFIRFPELIDIKNTVWPVEREKQSGHLASVEDIVSSISPYGLDSDALYNPKKSDLSRFSDAPIKVGYSIFGLDEKQKRTRKYIPKDYKLPKISPCLNTYKVFIAEAYGCGAIGEVPSTPVLSTPGELCTFTFLEIGPFGTQEEAANFISYIRTKFFRCLVGIQKQTQHATKKVYRFVPLQDFTDASDIDWSRPIPEVDRQLYTKYRLDEDDIEFIETHIQEMN